MHKLVCEQDLRILERYLQDADKIIILDSGRILKQGSFRDLAASGALDQISETTDDKEDSDSTPIGEDGMLKGPTERPEKIKTTSKKESALSGEADTPENNADTYRFFFQGFGATGLLIFLLAVAAVIVTTTMQTVWLKWWSASEIPRQLMWYLGFGGISLLSFVANFIMLL